MNLRAPLAVAVLVAAFACPAAAKTTLVCEGDLNRQIISDSPTILVLDEEAKTVEGHIGAYHYGVPGNSNAIPEKSFGPVPATFSDNEIVFTVPGYITSEHLNRLTGQLVPFSDKGIPVLGGRTCHVQQRQF